MTLPMSELDALLAEPVDHEHRRGRSLPMVLFGVALPLQTACGTVSRSATQTSWAIQQARYQARTLLAPLPDSDVLWLLLNGWRP